MKSKNVLCGLTMNPVVAGTSRRDVLDAAARRPYLPWFITPLMQLLLALLMPPAVAQAQDAYSTNADGSIYTYSTNADGSANIVAYAGPPWVVTIPTNINGLTVTSIGTRAFYYDYITSVTIPNSVTSIGDSAFWGCSSLTSVTIGNSVTTIGEEAFVDCLALTSVTIGNSVTTIGEEAFVDCLALTSVTIPNSVTSIGEQAFYYCTGLTNVTILGSVTSIGEEAFLYCPSLTSVYFTGNAPSPTNDLTVFYYRVVFYGGEPYVFYDPATVYYLPGTTGWGAMFDGLPTAPWFLPNPVILNNSPGFGVQPGGFGFTISWATNASVVVEAATNLANPVWLPLSTSPLTNGTNYFSDPLWTNYPMRFYRVTSAFTVGGTLTGLPAGDTVTLQDNGSDNLTLSNNGPFRFPTALPNGYTYSVTASDWSGTWIDWPPVTTNVSGTISGADVTNVAIQCTALITGNRDLDMYNAALADGTANGGVPAVMYTKRGGPYRVTASAINSENVAAYYSPWAWFDKIVGSNSCSSTTLRGGVIAFGDVEECGSGPYEY
jgi:hypothetical protein